MRHFTRVNKLHGLFISRTLSICALSLFYLPLLLLLETLFHNLIIIGGWNDFMSRNDKFPCYLSISKIRTLIQLELCRDGSSIQMDLSKNKRFPRQKAKNNVLSTLKRKKVPVCKMLHLSPLNICPPQNFEIYLKIIAYRGKFRIPISSKSELIFQYVMISWRYIVTNSFIIDAGGTWELPLVSGQSISKKIEIKQSRHLLFQKEEAWNKVGNLQSPNPNSPRRNQLPLFCNLEVGDKRSNGNIKIDLLVLH